jgi:type I restriction enzyme M protein
LLRLAHGDPGGRRQARTCADADTEQVGRCGSAGRLHAISLFRLEWGAMITGELKSKIDAVWNDFWSGGISNPLEVMEQFTYLLFIKALDERQTLAENKANRTGRPIDEVIFPEGEEFLPEGLARGRPYGDLRWSRFKHLPAADMFEVVGKYVFPFLHRRAEESTHAEHMRDARLTIPTPGLLQKGVDGLDAIPMADRDTKGDVYEYMLSKIATAGQNGQFRTPRHIIGLMVEMVAPQPDDVICDPASGTCGFLVAAGEHIRSRHPSALTDQAKAKHFHSGMFCGYDFDNTMLRIGSMNMQLHGVQNPTVSYRDSLAEDHAAVIEAYSLILANPPFAGSLDYEGTAKDLLQVVRTKKTELLFLALFLRLLRPGGRAAVIVPDGVLFGSTKAHKELRRILVEDQKLGGIVSLPSACSSPTPGSRLRFCGSPRPTPAAPTTSGSTTSRPTATASTTGARHFSTPTGSEPQRSRSLRPSTP